MRQLFIFLLVLCSLTLLPSSLWAYNLIHELNEDDPMFEKLQVDLQGEELDFYEYQLKKDETLLSVSQKSGVSISALISINKSNYEYLLKEGDFIVLPTQKGIFLTIKPIKDLEFLINDRLISDLRKERPFSVSAKYGELHDFFYFLKRKVLTKTEYSLWKKDRFRSPVLRGYVSSYFGMRTSPISGKRIKHQGVDIASNIGTQIFSSASGTVVRDGYNNIFGYFVVIEHGDGFESLYGHLLDSRVKVGDTVLMGEQIGYMGNTGASTGPHVHFEIHVDGVAVDPFLHLELE